ncbi:MAG: HAMP domain-containing protein [Deltaproteobacteria bacterium]|nr:HAMP domain-containing protein [Deltaproteobacteria bacterium]
MPRSIAFKLVLGIGAIVALFLGTCAYLNISHGEDALIEETVQGGRLLTDSVRRGLRYAMLRDDRDAVTHALKSIGGRDDLEGIRIFNKNGRIMFSSRETDLDRKVDRDARACIGCHGSGRPVEVLDPDSLTDIYADSKGSRHLQLIDPIYNEPECSRAPCHVHPPSQKVLGVLDLQMSLARFDAGINRTRVRQFIFSLTLISMLSLLLYLVIHRMVSRPIRSLLEGTRRVADGDLEHRIPPLGNDEIGKLADSFNRMTARLGEGRDQLMQSEKLASLGKLSAGVAHELNNPLTSILVFASSMLNKTTPDDPNREGLEVIVKEGQRCREVIAGLLDFARRTPPSIREGHIEEVVEASVAIARRQKAFDRIDFNIPDSRDLPVLPMDQGQLQQVFLNLFVNSLDAMPEGGSIHIDWRLADDGFVEVNVRDTGPGIPEDIRGNVFEPFFSTKGHQGTGLGLSIVWGIVEKHGGTVLIGPDNCNGASFTIRLPAGGLTPAETADDANSGD